MCSSSSVVKDRKDSHKNDNQNILNKVEINISHYEVIQLQNNIKKCLGFISSHYIKSTKFKKRFLNSC